MKNSYWLNWLYKSSLGDVRECLTTSITNWDGAMKHLKMLREDPGVVSVWITNHQTKKVIIHESYVNAVGTRQPLTTEYKEEEVNFIITRQHLEKLQHLCKTQSGCNSCPIPNNGFCPFGGSPGDWNIDEMLSINNALFS